MILTLGVNGVGKTTTIAKLARIFREEQKSVVLGACDTFRAAAIEQLEIWGERLGIETIKHRENADPAAVAFDAAKAARARGADVLILDTAGRLHTKVNLMEEMRKIKRVVGRELEGAPHEVLLIVDATNGQNVIAQAENFNEALSVSGIVITKLDGTAKGGFVLPIAHTLKIPIRYVGVGEQMDDLVPFRAREFAEGMVGGSRRRRLIQVPHELSSARSEHRFSGSSFTSSIEQGIFLIILSAIFPQRKCSILVSSWAGMTSISIFSSSTTFMICDAGSPSLTSDSTGNPLPVFRLSSPSCASRIDRRRLSYSFAMDGIARFQPV